jgi:tetratricopeptide (TPR) repeat protein
MKITTLALLLTLGMTARGQQPGGENALQVDLADGLFQRAKNLYAAGASSTNIDQRIAQFTRAGELFVEFLQRYPRHADARSAEYYYALCFYNSGRIDEAKKVFTSIIQNQRTGPYVAAASSAMAGDSFENKDYATAAALYAKLSANAVRPADRQRGYYFEALCHHYRNREREALACYQKVLADPEAATSPYLHSCRSAVGALLLKQGNAQEALPHFEDIVRSTAPDKTKAEAMLYAGITCLQLKDQAKAEVYFKNVLINQDENWRPYHADALTSMMQIRFDAKKYTEVIQIYRSNPLNTNDDRQAKRSNVVARSHMLLEQYLEAIPLFLEVQKLAPDTSLAFDASYNRLLCFYKIDGKHIVEQVDAFLEIYEKANKSHPRLHAALMMKAGALQNQGKIKEAADAYNLIDVSLIAENNRANLLYQRGWCLAHADDHQGAIRSLTRFLEDYPLSQVTAMRPYAISRS